jgi:hypothetical protein
MWDRLVDVVQVPLAPRIRRLALWHRRLHPASVRHCLLLRLRFGTLHFTRLPLPPRVTSAPPFWNVAFHASHAIAGSCYVCAAVDPLPSKTLESPSIMLSAVGATNFLAVQPIKFNGGYNGSF